MGCAWFGNSFASKSGSYEKRAMTWRVSGNVSLSDEGINAIPEIVFDQGPLVSQLEASNNQIEALDDGISSLSKLQRLILTNNRINSISSQIVHLSKLQVLILNKNNIASIPSTIGRLTNLEHLNLEDNVLREVPESIGYMTRLKMLQLGYNRLKCLPETMGGCHSLEYLDLKQNQVKKLPEYICKLEKLKVILADNNLIEELPEKIFSSCKALNTLSVHLNPIQTKDIQKMDDFKEYNDRRVQKYNKRIYGGEESLDNSFTFEEE